ncbi:MAG: sulfur carrier protein ThiS [Campylobacteraceae bacterium]|jgi:sulfur carrier protein|nr:sulfur carrier protein ThiS [Campylobacteraceae bacterium]
MVKININGEVKEFLQSQLSVTELLKIEKVEMPDMVSVQLNDDFLRQNEYEATLLKDGDVINFLYFMGGGA